MTLDPPDLKDLLENLAPLEDSDPKDLLEDPRVRPDPPEPRVTWVPREAQVQSSLWLSRTSTH